MLSAVYPAIEQLLPHRAPMLLLTGVGLHDGDLLLARSERRLLEALLPLAAGSTLLCLELMAQAAAAYAGLAAEAGSAAAEGPAVGATPGMLLGSRAFEMDGTEALEEQLLVGVIRRTPLTGGGLAKFAGQVWSGTGPAVDQALAAALESTSTAGAAAAASVFTAVDTCAGVQCLASADVSVYLPAGER